MAVPQMYQPKLLEDLPAELLDKIFEPLADDNDSTDGRRTLFSLTVMNKYLRRVTKPGLFKHIRFHDLAASLGDEPFGACELDPSVRPPVGADALFAVPFFCAGAAAAVEPTARPSPLKFLSDGLPKQLPIVQRRARKKYIERYIWRVAV